MRALVYTAPDCVEYREVPDPHPQPDQALVRVEATGICGSDLAGYHGKSTRRRPPLILGHEVVGRVANAITGSGLPIGQRVVVNPLQSCGFCYGCLRGRENQCSNWRLLGMDDEQGGFADLVVVDKRCLTPIPETLPISDAAMVEPLANTVHVFDMLKDYPPERLLIIGGGTQGALALMLAKSIAIPQVWVTEASSARRESARALGADTVIDGVPELVLDAVRETWPGGADAVLEAVGTAATRDLAVRAVRNGGTVVLLGLHDQRSDADFSSIVRKEVTLRGSFAYTRSDFAASLHLLVSGAISATPYVRELPLSDGPSAFARLSDAPDAVLKILLVP